MNIRKTLPLLGTILSACAAAGATWDFDAGAELRIRQEIMQHIPGLPYGGLHTPADGAFSNYIRYRPRVWGEVKLTTEDYGVFRIRARLVDEFRWNIEPYKYSTSWPGEVIFDNLFLEGKGLFDGFLDFRFGRQDLMGYCGLDHVFQDGTPLDGSRTIYTDMLALTLHPDENNAIDLFGLYNLDNARDFRLGYDEQRFANLAGRFASAENQDDWGYGAIWTNKSIRDMPWQVFAMQKRTLNYGSEYRNHTELVGVKLMPKWNEEWSSVFEVMSELNTEWSAYADIGWKSSRPGIKPFVNLGYHFLSEHWDPMWSRAVLDSEMFLYGTHDGVGFWSNMHFLKLSTGLDFGPYHELTASTGPMFAAGNDGLSGSDGYFKGELSQAKYSFPIILPEKGGRFTVVGHVLFEYFNPGDYYTSRRGAWFFRWQVEFKF